MKPTRKQASFDLTSAPLEGDSPDALIHALAARQHGIVARWQLIQAGVPQHRIEYRLKRGRIESVHHGIYRMGPVLSPRYREMAALLYCAPGAVLSHQSAGTLWGLHPPPPAAAPVTVSVVRNVGGPGSGVRVCRVANLGENEITHLDGLALTTPARTLLDLAGSVSSRELEQALARADRQQLIIREEIEALLERYPRRRGRARLRALLTGPESPALTRSEAEERFLSLVRKAGLRPPETNVMVKGFEVDTLWRAERLVVEIDGFAYHASPGAFERDRQRDGVLTAAGLRVMRVTWRQLTNEPEALLARLVLALATRGAPLG